MKIYNHKQAYNRIHACLMMDASGQTRGMSEDTLRAVIEMLDDCKCSNCQPICLGLKTALELRALNFHDAASTALTNACSNLGVLLVPQQLAQN